MDKTVLQRLLDKAKDASKKAYAPYSGFRVGAALITVSGQVFTGCNVENSSFSLTICAERNAVFQAILAGELEITAIAIYVDSDKLFPPCGACRQVLSEFAKDIPILYASKIEERYSTLHHLLPESFGLQNE